MPSSDLSWMIGARVRAISLVEPSSWCFELVGGGTLRTETVWRIIGEGRVQATSVDHGHQFGLQQPVDAAARAKGALAGATVRQASIARDTGDVVVDFANGSRLEVLTTSSSYEGWSIVSPRGDEVIGLGGGSIDVRKLNRRVDR